MSSGRAWILVQEALKGQSIGFAIMLEILIFHRNKLYMIVFI